MIKLRPAFIFTSAFLLGTVGILTLSYQGGLFVVRSIPIEVEGVTIEGKGDAKGIVKTTIGPAGLKTRLESKLKPFGRKKIWDIDLGDMKAAILKDEWVKDVFISRSFPNAVRVKIQTKTPALILVGAKGELWPVTEDGSLMSALPIDSSPDIPLLRGDVFSKDEAKRKEAIQFALELPERGSVSRKNISEIIYADDGYSIILMQPKVEVKLGHDKLAFKALRVSQVVNYMTAHELKGRVIDASFSKKILVRLRKGS